jgi:integrase
MSIQRNDAGKWVIDFTCKGKRITRVIGESKREAEESLAALKADILREKYGLGRAARQEVLFETHAKEYLELYAKQNKRSWRRDEISIDHLNVFFRGKYLSDITPELIEKYRAARRAEEISPATINREIACLKTIFIKAVEWGKTEADPTRRIKKFREEARKERILTAAEEKRLFANADPTLRPFLVVALNTGMRKGEILGLRWADVDFVKGFIRVTDLESKSGRERKIPMNAPVFDMLRGMDRKPEFVFMNGETGKSMGDVRTAFEGACRRAKKDPNDEKDPGITGLRVHDLRHTAATRMIEGGIDIVTVSRILGHSSIQMTMRYAHPTPETMRQAVNKLGEYMQESRKKVETVERRPLVSRSIHDN